MARGLTMNGDCTLDPLELDGVAVLGRALRHIALLPLAAPAPPCLPREYVPVHFREVAQLGGGRYDAKFWCNMSRAGAGAGLGQRVAGMLERARKRLSKRAKRGFRGWPLATVALYGPDNTIATKLSVGILPGEDPEATDLRRWSSKQPTDIREDNGVAEEVLAFITEAGAKSVVMTDRIIGCPHEEGIDYEGATCPACPFWAGRDRWTGKRQH